MDLSCSMAHPRPHAATSSSRADIEPGTGIAVKSFLQFHPFTTYPLLNLFHGGRRYREGQPIDAEQEPVEMRLVLGVCSFCPRYTRSGAWRLRRRCGFHTRRRGPSVVLMLTSQTPIAASLTPPCGAFE